MAAAWNWVTYRPGWASNHFSTLSIQHEEGGLKEGLSNGCSLCVVCPGNSSIITPCSQTRSNASAFFVWIVCLSRRSFLLLIGWTVEKKCFSHTANSSLLTCPLLRLTGKLVPWDALSFSSSLERALLKISAGVTYSPPAPSKQAAVAMSHFAPQKLI